jgi:hypothetical protein
LILKGGPTKQDFTASLLREIDAATADVERRLGSRAVRNYEIAYGDPKDSNLISVETAVERLLKAAPLVAPIIDISVVELRDDATVVFVRPSSHHPVAWENTWNLPAGHGPFKVLIANVVSDRRSKKKGEP